MPERRRPRRAPAAAATSRARAPRPRRASEPAPILLAVDVGNSDVVVGRFVEGRVERFWRITSAQRTADEIGLLLDVLLARAGGSVGPPEAAVVCSVVPSLTRSWSQALQRITRRPVLEVGPETAGSLPIRYRDKGAVGADRIANAVAVRALYGVPAIVVDLGTATTFDCISERGAYLGGAIAPGVGTSAEELFRRAARLSRVELRAPAQALGRTTEEALRAGIVWGAAGQVDALVRRLALEMRGTPHVIATGGYAEIVVPECETINRVDEALTLKGMYLLWREHA